MHGFDALILDCRACTLAPGQGWGLIADAAIGWRDGVLAFVGARDDVPAEAVAVTTRVHHANGALVTPALIDCHTHLVFAGERIAEYEQRLEGASYAQIAQAGGGINATVQVTRAASEDELLAQSLPRARALLGDGVATLEIQSGYGLDLDSEQIGRAHV